MEMMNFEELDGKTRERMLAEFEAEEVGGNPYRGERLSAAGRAAFPDHIREAIRHGNEQSLLAAINKAAYWNATELYERNGVVRSRSINMQQAAEQLSLSEFNTWYVRGFAKRLMDEGEQQCQAYRGAQPKWEPADCAAHEGQLFPAADIYNGHRATYWPKPGNKDALSIPFNPGCHHTIRRVKK
jgi:hypothetical protein